MSVHRLLPHRYPMLLLDRVVDLEPGVRVTGIKAVTLNEPWYAAARSDDAYPATLLLESWVQAAGVLAVSGVQASDRVMLLGSVSGAEFASQVRPGDVIEHHARLVRVIEDTAVLQGHSTVGSATVLTVRQAVVVLRPAAHLRDGGTR